MKRTILMSLAAVAVSLASAAAPGSTEAVFAACPEKAGGIYFAYGLERDSVAPPPEGFSPVYVSHYGRHGSRWPVKAEIYKICSDYFQNQQLAENVTTEGKAVWKLVNRCSGDAWGHLGELTPMGERQHRGVARRMAERFPELFADSARVEARSSVEPRCIMSMAAFCEALREINPKIDVRRHASPGDMEFIHHSTPEARAMNGDDAPWRWEFDAYRDSVSECPAAAAKLFKKTPQGDSLRLFMRSLYDIAISVQNIDSLEAPLLEVFSPAELSGLWKASNFMQYVGNARSPLGNCEGVKCAGALLQEIVARADEMLASGEVKADLRFGHDTDLLRLVSLTGIGGYGGETESPELAALIWRNYDISPMAANLQFVFYKNEKGDVIVAPRLNERPVTVSDVPQVAPGYYDWELLKIYFSTL